MRRLLAALSLLAVLAFPATVAAGPPADYDLCPNLDGIQYKVPHGYILRISVVPPYGFYCADDPKFK